MKIIFLSFSAILMALVLVAQQFYSMSYMAYYIIVPLVALGVWDMLQQKHTLRRNFPLFGRGRWIMEFLRPFIRQYFIESDMDGAPINRAFRSVVYQRAKGERDTLPFGTKIDVYRVGYEWIGHSLAAHELKEKYPDIRVTIGGKDCKKKYSSSIFNISAMSFGALSGNAIESLNLGAKLGGFYHNTGEGGLSEYHLKHGGDLVWQIGTAYFGCRDDKGVFSPKLFADKSAHDAVKMIEIKLSQGAKPGHGGILPADKNTVEIARNRGVEPFTQVNSPPAHSAFKHPIELMHFIAKLRDLSGGKPIGFKLAIGQKSEFIAICKAMIETDIAPDFITVDGGEGGTGAAPLEYSNSIGMPLRDAVAFVCDCLTGFGLKQEIKVIVSGKIFTGFHLIKNFSLGADICNSARGNMLALGCVQSLICNTNHCPSGVATQNLRLSENLLVDDKSKRVNRFHNETVRSTAEIIASAGLLHTCEINRAHIYRRVSPEKISRYDEVFPYIKAGSLLTNDIPENFRKEMLEATSTSFTSSTCSDFNNSEGR